MPELKREQFAQQVIDAVRARFPLVKIARAEQPFSLRLNGRIAALENLFRTCQLAPDEIQRHIERWAVELLRDSEGTPDRTASFDDVKERVLPMIVSSDYSEFQKSHIAMQPLVEGLHVAYVLDGDRTIAYLPTDVLNKWNVSLDDLHELAILNLIERSTAIQGHAAKDADDEIELILFQMLDGFDATRLLLPSLHQRLREMLGSPFAAAVPNRDILLCFRQDEETVSRIREKVAHDFRTMPHQVTDKLFLVTPDGISPL